MTSKATQEYIRAVRKVRDLVEDHCYDWRTACTVVAYEDRTVRLGIIEIEALFTGAAKRYSGEP